MYTGTTAAYVRRSDVHTTNVSTSDHAHPTSLVDDETDADTKGSSGVTETVYLESMPEFHKLLLLQVVWLRPSWIVQLSSANCLTNILKHSCIQVIASALACPRPKVSAGAMQDLVGAAKLTYRMGV